MRQFSLLVFALLFSFCDLVAQGNTELGVKRPCYERPKGAKRGNDWQCGKIPGVVDCNEKLTYDEDKKLILGGKSGLAFTGTCETCHLNGLLERRISFVNGKDHGFDTTYYSSGCPQIIRNHINGLESGKWSFYYDSTGQIAWEMNYAQGQKDGPQLYLAKNGDTTRHEFYKVGKLNGVKKSYYPDNKLEKSIEYKDGLMNGAYRMYSKEGLLLQDLSFKTGKKHGELKYCFDDGTLVSLEHWNMDTKDGEFIAYYEGGIIRLKEVFRKGIPEGWSEEYWPEGKPKRKARFTKGEVVEEYRYDEFGVETYRFGVQESSSGDEDDELPSSSKKKKKSKSESN